MEHPCGSRAFHRDETAAAMYIELLLSTLMLLGFIFFLTIFGRMLSERNRMLAANRTVAWLYAHLDEQPKHVGEFDAMATDGRLADWLAKWHFREGGKSAGMVLVRHGQDSVQHGLMTKVAGSLEKFSQDELAEDKTAMVNANGSVDQEGNPIENDPLKDMGSVNAGLLAGLVNFLTSDFKHYHAHVSFGMPLMFPKAAFEFFGWGEMVSTMGENDYLFIRPKISGGAVYPLLAAGAGKGVLGNLAGTLQKQMEAAGKQNEDLVLYRPYIYPRDDTGERAIYFTENSGDLAVASEPLRALLIFELYASEPATSDMTVTFP